MSAGSCLSRFGSQLIRAFHEPLLAIALPPHHKLLEDRPFAKFSAVAAKVGAAVLRHQFDRAVRFELRVVKWLHGCERSEMVNGRDVLCRPVQDWS